MQHERMGVSAQFGNDEGHSLCYQPGHEGDIAREPVGNDLQSFAPLQSDWSVTVEGADDDRLPKASPERMYGFLSASWLIHCRLRATDDKVQRFAFKQ